jgi:4-amino-4-deoxy-L-arabinose transferase-like glycosyltransferase
MAPTDSSRRTVADRPGRFRALVPRGRARGAGEGDGNARVRAGRVLTGIVLTAIAVRVALAATVWLATRDPAAFTAPDTETYLNPARELLATGAYTSGGQPEVVRTPGYSLLLVPGLLLGRVEAVTVALQIALAALTVVGVYALAAEVLGSPRTALAAAALYALDPLSIVYSSLLLTETLFTTVVVWATWLLARHARGGRARDLLAGTALLAAAYVRPLGYFLPFGAAAFAALHAARSRRWRALPRAAFACALAAALLAPWQLRNAAAADYGGFSAVRAQSLYFYDAGARLAREEGIPLEAEHARMGWPGQEEYLRVHPEQRAWTPGQRFRYMEREAKRILSADLPESALVHLRGTGRVLLGTGGGELQSLFRAPVPGGDFAGRLARGRPAPADLLHLPGALSLLAVYVLAAWWLLRVRARWSAPMLLVLCIAAYMVAVVGPAGGARFRHPAMPAVCLAAGAGAAALRDRRSGCASTRVRGTAAGAGNG